MRLSECSLAADGHWQREEDQLNRQQGGGRRADRRTDADVHLPPRWLGSPCPLARHINFPCRLHLLLSSFVPALSLPHLPSSLSTESRAFPLPPSFSSMEIQMLPALPDEDVLVQLACPLARPPRGRRRRRPERREGIDSNAAPPPPLFFSSSCHASGRTRTMMMMMRRKEREIERERGKRDTIKGSRDSELATRASEAVEPPDRPRTSFGPDNPQVQLSSHTHRMILYILPWRRPATFFLSSRVELHPLALF